jgi:hypothetical protein
MTLTTHALAGAAVATLFPARPLLGFFAGFASHFALDSIPHWDYKIRSVLNRKDLNNISVARGPQFWKDAGKVIIDCALGFSLGLFLFGTTPEAAVAVLTGATGALFPDGLQFLYFKFKNKSLLGLQRFHESIQKDSRFQERPVIGIALQFLLIVAIIGGHFLVVYR